MKLHKWTHPDGSGWTYIFWCPGCDEAHTYTVRTDKERPAWKFNGNTEKPTFMPSLLYPTKRIRCHLFMTDGKIKFLEDCGHKLKGQTVDMVDFPEGYQV